jgi:hypothetical protein
MRWSFWLGYQSVLGMVLATWLTVAAAAQTISFVDSAPRAQLHQVHFDGSQGEPYLPHLMVAGIAVFDYDCDGLLDVYLLGGRDLFANAATGETSDSSSLARALEETRGNTLYRNRGDGTFVDVTDAAGVRSGAHALGVVAADLDNDGDPDLITSNFGPAELYVNNGDGTFSLHQNFAALAQANAAFGAGVACLDIDHDGTLDIFVSNYVDFSLSHYRSIAAKSTPYPPGPKDFPPSTNQLYRNLGDGLFADVSVESRIAEFPGPSMGVVCADFDDDHDCDIFVCSDAAPNQLFLNDGKGRFDESALLAGLAYDIAGNVNGSMGVDAGDYDNDGRLDLLITNYTGQMPVLYRNTGNGLFEDRSRIARIGREVIPHTNWGVGLVDFDNDRDLDAFFANGHFLKNIRSIDDRTDFRVANTLMENDGTGRFTDISLRSGPGMRIAESSRGSAFDDMDQDGDLDVVILNANAPPTFLENVSTAIGQSIRIRLVGRHANRDAVGAIVRVQADGKTQMGVVHAGRGYQSHYGTELHFGLGNAKAIDRVEVVWPGGESEWFSCEPAQRRVTFIQGHGVSHQPIR